MEGTPPMSLSEDETGVKLIIIIIICNFKLFMENLIIIWNLWISMLTFLFLLLHLDSDHRITSEQALAHGYLQQYSDPTDEPTSEPWSDQKLVMFKTIASNCLQKIKV